MNRYTFTQWTCEHQRDCITLQLRRDGFPSSRQGGDLLTTATRAQIALSWGCALVVEPPKVGWSLAGCARIYRVTIREIAKEMGITLKRVREVRAMREVSELTAWEFVQAIKAVAAKKSVNS